MGTPRGFRTRATRPGGPLAEAFRRRGLSLIETEDATAACIMAAVTAELTGTPGLVLAAGHADLGAGVIHAARDRAPVLILCEEAPDPSDVGLACMDGARGGPASAGAKAWLPVVAASAGHWVAHAGRLAMTEPRGPVVLTLASGVAGRAAVPVATRVHPDVLPPPDGDALDAAAQRLLGARRPVLIAGLQCRTPGATAWIRALAEALPAPVLAAPKAKGVLPDPHPLALGTITALSTRHPVLALADLVVTLGLDPLELEDPGETLPIPVLRLAAASGPDERAPDAAARVVGEISLILEELAPRLRSRQAADWDVAWLDRMKRSVRASRAPDVRSLSTEQVVRLVREATPAGTVATADCEMRAVAASSWEAVAPGELLVANPPSIDGFAVPAAVAAQLARPRARVIGFTSVAGLLASATALPVAVDHALPLVLIVSVSSPAGTAAGRAGSTASAADRGRSLGLASAVATSLSDLARALEQALAGGAPTLIEAHVHPVTEGL